jgi:hypothetical protein
LGFKGLKEYLPSETGKELLLPISIKKKAAEGNTSSNSFKNISRPEGSEKQAEKARISPSKFFPLPKAKAVIRWGWSARRSDIITCSPFKNSLLNITKNRSLQDSSRPKVKLCDGTTVGRPTCSQGKKKKEKENIFSPAFAEQYEEPITEN